MSQLIDKTLTRDQKLELKRDLEVVTFYAPFRPKLYLPLLDETDLNGSDGLDTYKTLCFNSSEEKPLYLKEEIYSKDENGDSVLEDIRKTPFEDLNNDLILEAMFFEELVKDELVKDADIRSKSIDGFRKDGE